MRVGLPPHGAALAALVSATVAVAAARAASPSAESYVAAVAQTVFVDGTGGCCPSAGGWGDDSALPPGACPGAEPLGAIPRCQGNESAVAAACKMGNVRRAVALIAEAAGKGAQIIVFPEGGLGIAAYHYREGGKNVSDGGGVASGGLAEPIPNGGAGVVPCDWASGSLRAARAPALRELSCAARRSNITVVVDMGDLVPCSPANPFNASEECGACPPEGVMRFNTLVAIGDTGEVLAKYHKEHRYLASRCVGDGHGQPGGADPATFTTSFGVTFGMLLCYDICFHTPAIAMAAGESKITNFVFATHWENEEGPPMALAVPFFQGWARGVGANLLAANQGMGLMHTGSGIFDFAGTALATAWEPGNPHYTALLVARVPVAAVGAASAGPRRAGNAQPAQPWPGTPYSAAPPVHALVSLAANGTTFSRTVAVASGFACTVTVTTAAGSGGDASAFASATSASASSDAAAAAASEASAAATTDWFALEAVNGVWLGDRAGNLPARGCAFYRVPLASVAAAGGPDKWVPWGAGGRPLYSTVVPTPTSMRADLGANVTFAIVALRGSFPNGDIVRPSLAGAQGAPLGHAVDVDGDNRGFRAALDPPAAVSQALLLVNTHDSPPPVG